MKIAIMSDLHQDFRGNKFDHNQKINADVIVIAGDLQEGDGVASLIPYVKNDQYVIYVPGNHEYYNNEINTTRLSIRNSGHRYGVNVLDRNVKVIGNVRFVGVTLWTDYMLYGLPMEYACKTTCMNSLNDHYVIRSNDSIDGRFMPDDTQKLFFDDLAWLNSVLSERHNGPTVVVTHHAPSYTSISPEFRNAREFNNAGYASNLEVFISNHKPEIWIHGHVHSPSDYTIMDSRIICNPRGYTHEHAEWNFVPKIIDL
jgi:Icc-related predicted phosphoesterase